MKRKLSALLSLILLFGLGVRSISGNKSTIAGKQRDRFVHQILR